MNTILVHHGIIGQKWGVRRYQNKDGSLTALGKNRRLLNEMYRDVHNDKQTIADQKKLNYDLAKSGFSDGVIKKGSKFSRYAGEENVDGRRKYVSLLDSDTDRYGKMLDVLGIDKNSDVFKYELTAKKDLKIADAKMVTDYVIDKYGDVSMKEMSDLIFSVSNGDNLYVTASNEKKILDNSKGKYDEAYDYLAKGQIEVTKLLNDKLFSQTAVKDIDEYFKSNGYDAIVDIEDYIGLAASYPLILLDPQNSVEISNKEKIK